MNKSEIRRLRKERDAELKKAERLEKQAIGKSQFIQEHLLRQAQEHRNEAWACSVVLGDKA